MEAAIFTAARSGEIRGAIWSEVDLAKSLWTVPADRMKAGKEHVVPLSPAAKRVFQRAADLRTAGSKFVFQGLKREKPLSDMTLIKVLRDMGETVTAHGFRSTASTILNERGYSADVIEAALAHQDEDEMRRIYNRALYLPERKKLMQDWADLMDSFKKQKVVRRAA